MFSSPPVLTENDPGYLARVTAAVIVLKNSQRLSPMNNRLPGVDNWCAALRPCWSPFSPTYIPLPDQRILTVEPFLPDSVSTAGDD